jgi:imidazolonepropionase-like amidohydrolase
LASGRRADLIVVSGNPLHDLVALEAVQIVVKDRWVAFFTSFRQPSLT